MQKRIETIAQLVIALGGSAAVADLLGCTRSEPDAWIIQRWIPNGWHYRLDRAARLLKGLDVSPEVFGLDAGWPLQRRQAVA